MLSLYNTLTRQVEPFTPLEAGKVQLYVCGPTVYDDAHLGHARCYLAWDVLYRFLRYLGYDVRYARNITDVDDKILDRARERGQPFRDLARQYTERFHADMAALNLLAPTDEPRATDHIDEMIQGIQVLLEKNAAYVTTEGSVYFRTAAKPGYGKLCRQPADDLKSGARVEADPLKESPLDFALWKGVPPTDPDAWDAPWGRGRPGWHLECSAMNHRIFGDQIDIHAGGADLIFPHHENEIAQSEIWTGRIPFARYWLHNGFVNVSGEKMSKSLGNFATVRTLLAHYDANTLRYFLLTHHYRMPVDCTDEALAGARNRVVKIHRAFKAACTALEIHPEVLREYDIPGKDSVETYPLLGDFERAMAQDLNTAQALAVLDEAVSALNTAVSEAGGDLPRLRKAFVEALAVFSHLGFGRQGVFSEESLPRQTVEGVQTLYRELTGQWLEPDGDPADLVAQILRMRQDAKATRNWTQADAIRKHLADIGIQVMDSKDGTTSWEWIP